MRATIGKHQKKLYKLFIDRGYTDPCPLHSKVDNLNNFYIYEKLFINPPFSQLNKWVDKAIEWASHDCEVYLLMPSRTDTKYFKKLADFRCIIWFFIGRLHFNDSKQSAPFPTMLVRLCNDTYENSFAHGTLDDFIKIWEGEKDYDKRTTTATTK